MVEIPSVRLKSAGTSGHALVCVREVRKAAQFINAKASGPKGGPELHGRRIERRQRERVVKPVLAAGTTQPCNGGQPGSVVGLRHKVAIAGVIWAGETTPFSG